VATRRQRAFTLIEILVVIGIIAILVTLVTLGVSHLGKASKRNSTMVTMQNLKALLTEKEIAGGLATVNALYPQNPQTPNVPTPLFAPGDVRKDPYANMPNAQPNTPVRYNAPAVALTQQVLRILEAIPNNKAMVAKLPSSNLMEPLPTGYISIMSADQTTRAFTPPLILDAWGNPIIYVPAAGLSNLYVAGVSIAPKTAPDGRGFWASAGADGIFGGYYDKDGNGQYTPGTDGDYGDDNIYSFEQ
jgi:prepilin-type N-terminal cleavage/methylation domain-containing protein